LFAAVMALPCAAEVVTVGAMKDNTLYKIADGSISNGLGAYCFAGATSASELRRAVVAFDLSAVPAGVRVTSATMTLNCSRQATPGHTVRAYRLLQEWGEGTSNASGNEGVGAVSTPGDATWLHTSYDNRRWAVSGGTFAPGLSAATTVAGLGAASWSGAGLVADVQYWVDHPGENFGWILIGNEDEVRTAQRFDTKNNPSISARPKLRIEYTRCRSDFNGDSQTDFFDYLDFVQAYSSGDLAADFNLDQQIDFFDYLDFVQEYDACS
jgi:hypothetical protein